MKKIKNIIISIFDFIGLGNTIKYYSLKNYIVKRAKLKKGIDYNQNNLFRNFHKDILFLHIPKAAGMSVVDTLYNQNVSHHATAFDYLKEDKAKFDSMFKFAIVRNPYDRLYSAYKYLENGGTNLIDKIWWDLYLSKYDNFQSFIENGGLKKAIECHAEHFIPQNNFIYHNDTLLCDYVSRLENVKDLEKILSDKLNKEINLSKINVTNSQIIEKDNLYTRSMYNIVNELYEKDFELFGYKQI